MVEVLILGPFVGLTACMVWRDPDLRFESQPQGADNSRATLYRQVLR